MFHFTPDRAETKGSVLFLISDAHGRQLIHCPRSPFFPRYRVAETIDVTSDNGDYGFRDWFHTFSASVSGDTVFGINKAHTLRKSRPGSRRASAGQRLQIWVFANPERPDRFLQVL